MSHPLPAHDYPVQCQLCRKEATDAISFDAGNNAEYPISVNLCDAHLDEEEKTGYKFQQKYGEKIDELAYARLVDQADSPCEDR